MEPPPANRSRSAFKSLFFGGLLPIIAFTVIEDRFGPIYGVIAGLVFGIGEIIYEWRKDKKVSTITWVGNGLLIGLGTVSIIANDGIWFKLQPALIELFMTILLWGGLLMKRNILLLMMEKQGQSPPPILAGRFNGLTFRLGIFFLLHAGLATWAAFSWTTAAWAMLKGIGLTVSLVLWMGCEILFIRRSIKKASRS